MLPFIKPPCNFLNIQCSFELVLICLLLDLLNFEIWRNIECSPGRAGGQQAHRRYSLITENWLIQQRAPSKSRTHCSQSITKHNNEKAANSIWPINSCHYGQLAKPEKKQKQSHHCGFLRDAEIQSRCHSDYRFKCRSCNYTSRNEAPQTDSGSLIITSFLFYSLKVWTSQLTVVHRNSKRLPPIESDNLRKT